MDAHVHSFKHYQEFCKTTAVWPNVGSNYAYTALGLGSEVGGLQGKLKKIIRDKGGVISEEDKVEIARDLGDCLYYIAATCSELGLSLEAVAESNYIKLKSRKERGVLHGSGDTR